MRSSTPSHQKTQQGVPTRRLVIGGLSILAVKRGMDGDLFRIGQIQPTNAFCVRVKNLSNLAVPFLSDFYYVYVRVTYSGYRGAVRRLLGSAGDIDHVLSQKLATSLGIRYVLAAVVLPSVNRSHGAIEKLGLVPDGQGVKGTMPYLSKVIYMDSRIEEKLHSKKVSISSLSAYNGFDRDQQISHEGLDLRYGVNINRSLGFDRQAPAAFVASLKEFMPRHAKD